MDDRTPCPILRTPAWCETHPNCLAIPPEWPGVRCLLGRGHVGQHKGQGRVWGVPVDASPEGNAARAARRRRTNTVVQIAALLGLAVQPIDGRRR
jgi:hypothetical protein